MAVLRILLLAGVWLLMATPAKAGLHTWDGRHAIDRIELKIVYFVPRDRTPLPDWRDRVDYFRRRLEQFHQREFQGQSQLVATVHPEPFVSEFATHLLREGDGDAIFYKTLREVDQRLNFAQGERQGFPILLVLSDINWRPLDDFYRLKPGPGGPEFEGNYREGEHFPGAASGGARATYLAREGKGWGLVSADGWRVPYRGSDCVIYHEGCGHTIGLPHPEPANGSVMSQGQYQGWISESWLDRDQKARLGWTPPDAEQDLARDLFSHFRALQEPRVPHPDEPVALQCDWPAGCEVKSCRVRIQLDPFGPWLERPVTWSGAAPERIPLGSFDRPTPVSYRIDAALADGQSAELWGYFQVRQTADATVIPPAPLPELAAGHEPVGGTSPIPDLAQEIELLPRIDPEGCWHQGDWQVEGDRLVSPKAYGARIEIPGEVPAEYELTVIAEPLDPPDGLILGQCLDQRRFVVLVNYTPDAEGLSALENIDGRNVGANATTRAGDLLKQGRPSEIRCTVRRGRVTVRVDGVTLIDWTGDPSRLSLSDYWKTPGESRLFLGAYDCRYRFHRITLRPLASADDP